MRLKTTKRLLNLASLALLGTSGAVGYWGMTPASRIDFESPTSDAPAPKTGLTVNELGKAKTGTPVSSPPMAGAGSGIATNWGRAMRRPIFDPPPPAPVVVAKAPPQPIRARLLATLIEAENSMAMLKLASGQVVFRKVGESLGADEPSVEISKIETGSISIRRGNEEMRLSVEGTNGK
jgi:hypothetical protein